MIEFIPIKRRKRVLEGKSFIKTEDIVTALGYGETLDLINDELCDILVENCYKICNIVIKKPKYYKYPLDYLLAMIEDFSVIVEYDLCTEAQFKQLIKNTNKFTERHHELFDILCELLTAQEALNLTYSVIYNNLLGYKINITDWAKVNYDLLFSPTLPAIGDLVYYSQHNTEVPVAVIKEEYRNRLWHKLYDRFGYSFKDIKDYRVKITQRVKRMYGSINAMRKSQGVDYNILFDRKELIIDNKVAKLCEALDIPTAEFIYNALLIKLNKAL